MNCSGNIEKRINVKFYSILLCDKHPFRSWICKGTILDMIRGLQLHSLTCNLSFRYEGELIVSLIMCLIFIWLCVVRLWVWDGFHVSDMTTRKLSEKLVVNSAGNWVSSILRVVRSDNHKESESKFVWANTLSVWFKLEFLELHTTKTIFVEQYPR